MADKASSTTDLSAKEAEFLAAYFKHSTVTVTNTDWPAVLAETGKARSTAFAIAASLKTKLSISAGGGSPKKAASGSRDNGVSPVKAPRNRKGRKREEDDGDASGTGEEAELAPSARKKVKSGWKAVNDLEVGDDVHEDQP